MGAGLSMASVNKIKELANSREYSLALELVEHQDLTKSLNPQFLRLCGEVYIKNNRYEDARRCLIMAHRLGPESKRIIYSFVELYLRMGYFRLAKKYYDMYMFDADAYDSKQIEYIWKKHLCTETYSDLETLLAGYAHNLDYDWSYELYLLYKKEGKDEEAGILAELYHASYKNSEYSHLIRQIEAGEKSADTYFDVYAKTEVEDDAPRQETLRKEELELLAADDLRMHPKEAEITIMYEDAYTPAESEKKIQKLLRKQAKEDEKKEKKLLKKQKQQEQTDTESSGDTEQLQPEKTELSVEEAKQESVEQSQDAFAETEELETKEKQGFLKKLLRKKQNMDASQDDLSEKEENVVSDASLQKDVQTDTDAVAETAEIKEQLEQKATMAVEISTQEQPETESDDTDADRTGRAEEMRQKTRTIADDIVVVDDDDGFEAEAETIEELASAEENDVTSTHSSYVFETVELVPEDFGEYEVDDFTDTVDEEFGEMKFVVEQIQQPEESEEPDEPQEEAVEEPETEEMPQEEAVEEPEIEEVPQEEAVEESEVEEVPQEEAVEEPEVEEVPQEEAVEEPEVEEVPQEETVEESEFQVAPFTTKPEKKKLDFPVFKSSLFPNYHKDVKQVENNFDEIMVEAQDKMSENMQKEEQMQREAEALLASLGINMDSIVSSKPAEKEVQPDREGPSRDVLKASLKIDSAKKDLLKKVKTYK